MNDTKTQKITIDTLSDLHQFINALPEHVTCDIPNGELFGGDFTVARFENNGVILEVTYTGLPEETIERPVRE